MPALPLTPNARNFALAHALARIGFGINIALHGLTRIPTFVEFEASLHTQFAPSPLPPGLVTLTAYAIVGGEAVVGILLVLGLAQRFALVAGGILMWVLLFGTCLVQNWNVAGLQLPYLAFYAVLLATLHCDRYSLDALRHRSVGAAP